MGYSPFRPLGVTHHVPSRVYNGLTLYSTTSGDAVYLIDFPTEGIGLANQVFRAHRYGPDHPALAGRTSNTAACEWLNRAAGLPT